jgi:hypothetical protein
VSPSRPGFAGVTRVCPHCKANILANSAVCPSCKHHLRFDGAAQRGQATTALRVEGTVGRPADGEAWEYSMVLSIRNERGEEIDRKLVGVGAMRPGEQRTFALAVEIYGDAEEASAPRRH